MYRRFFKRFFDFVLSLAALIILSPVLLLLTTAGALAMRGNPFFVQPRPGKIGKDGKERIFNLVKFRSMTNARGKKGNMLPDHLRLTWYGRLLRATSLDELPELWNILVGEMSIVGPRPLLVKYLPLYSQEQRRRHEVRPGLTGYAQVNGRNIVSWEDKFRMDVEYVDNITFWGDIKILIQTVLVVIRHTGVSSKTYVTTEEFKGSEKEREQSSV